jgi:hypothetical protein
MLITPPIKPIAVPIVTMTLEEKGEKGLQDENLGGGRGCLNL